MIRGRCPICGKAFEVARLDDLPTFPFCSDRCKLIDLGRWIDGDYAIPGPPAPGPQATEGSEDGYGSPSAED
jgi:endogenous inhibitor of DNA gyrase (YacG/DUF329 family)